MSRLTPTQVAQQPAWWKEATVYQIYPASFRSANGGQYGDLRGILEKVDYLAELGVDMCWLCPIYKSPRVDMGYDISSFDELDEVYGTMEDWQELVDALHARGIRLIMDLVVNHTSDQHPWFEESRSSKNSPKRDWYIWRPAKHDAKGNRRPPNNWASIWGGSAWQWDEATQEYYLHLFSPQQPDLNFECRAMLDELKAMMTRWFKKGIDGFRCDAINFVSKPLTYDFPDAPITVAADEYQPAFSIFNHGPRIHEILGELHRDVFSKFDCFTVGEAALTTPELAVAYTRQDREDKELQMLFQTEHIDLYAGFPLAHDGTTPPKRVFSDFKAVIAKWQTTLMENASWGSIYDANHDQPRPLDNILEAEVADRYVASTLLAVFNCSLIGTLFIYQGEELGAMNVPHDWPIENYLDLVTVDFYNQQLASRKAKHPGTEPDMADVMRAIQRKARDNARTPMPWDSSETAGFGTDKPWMKVNPDNKVCNVADQLKDEHSILAFWKRMIALRKKHPVLTYGTFEAIESPSDVFCYRRTLTRDGTTTSCLVVLNFGKPEVEVGEATTKLLQQSTSLLIGNYEQNNTDTDKLRAYEARVHWL